MIRGILVLFLAGVVAFQLHAKEPEKLVVGSKSPHFKAITDEGKIWNSKKHVGKKNIVVYFYPAAMTSGCTKQACAYRDLKTEIDQSEALVIGISGDNPEGLKLFRKAYGLNFPLLADEKSEIARKFGVPVREGGKITREVDGKQFDLVRGATASRWTFIIDKKGRIVYKNEQVNAEKDAAEVIEFLKKHK